MKKLISVCLSCLLLAAVLTACGSSGNGTGAGNGTETTGETAAGNDTGTGEETDGQEETTAKARTSGTLTLNVYNWGEYISDGSEDSYDTISEFEKWYEEKYGQAVRVN